MLKLKYLIFCLFFTSCLFSQDLSLGQGGTNQKGYYEEINFELANNKIILPVKINGKTYRFLLDTGAPNLLSKRVLSELNIQNTKKINVHDSNHKVDTLEMVSIPHMQIGDLDFVDNVALSSDLDNHFVLKCFKLDGFIGSNLLKNSILKISLKDKKIIITDDIKKLKLKSKPSSIKLIGEQKAPYISISIIGKNKKKASEDVLIDTGMDGFYEMSNRAFKIFSGENIFEELSRSSGAGSIGLFGTPDIKEQVLIRSNLLRVNNTYFKNLITNTTDDNNSRMGLELAEYGDIIIDFIHQKFYFEAEKEITFDKKAPVYSSTAIGNKLVIGFVWDKSYQDRLHFGDEIIRIKDYKLNEMHFCDVVDLRNTLKNEDSYEMEVRSKDNKTTLLKIERK
ncbi:MAG: retropepsin-like aspartic protease [Flavobacterium sp.]